MSPDQLSMSVVLVILPLRGTPFGFTAWARGRAKVLQVRSRDRSMRSVAVFYLLAFAVSWSIVIPQAAASRSLINVQLPGAVGFLSPLAPMLAAVLMFFFNDTATTEIYTLSLHDALPI